ncbi:MAG: DUF3108 domain-containing protein [Deltaproteobacteria bacterium]|nr:DUF3108 domain-containing protein [Deltaproteobacteria bacterium]
MLRYLIIFIGITLGAAVLIPNRTESSAPAPKHSVAAGNLLEELRYQVDVWVFKDAIDTQVTLKRLDQQRYRAQVNGKAVGLLGVFSGHWQGRYATEMILVDGKFMPVVYREESQHGSKKNLKEYRFDYDKKVVELFKWDNGKQQLTKRWQTALSEPMYDPLSFYYNQRLQGMSFGKQGETLKFQGIPYPKPEDIVLRIGPDTPQGRKIMVTLDNRVFENERNHVYALLDKDGVPVEAWTDVLRFGRITGKLKPGSKRFNGRLLASGGIKEG